MNRDILRDNSRAGASAPNMINYDCIRVVELIDSISGEKMVGIIIGCEGEEVTVPFQRRLALTLHDALGEVLKKIGREQVLVNSN